MQNPAFEAVRLRLRACDFTEGGAEQEKLRAALARLTIARRLVIEMRCCGIVRERVRGVMVERTTDRMSMTQIADALGCSYRTVEKLQQRALADLVDLIAAEDRKERLAQMRESRSRA